MSQSIMQQLQSITKQLSVLGLYAESEFIDNALKYSGSSLELYFKIAAYLSQIDNNALSCSTLKHDIKKCHDEIIVLIR